MLTINGPRRFWYDRTLQYQALRGADTSANLRIVGGGLIGLALVIAGVSVASRLGYLD